MKKQGEDFEFTIIAGELKGRRILSPNLGVTRPPLSRLRKSIFDFLMPYIVDARYLDLFSGTGSYLFEAVSRGAAEVVGVEMEPALANAINQQAEKYGVAERLTCLQEDVFEAIPKLRSEGRAFDIIMIAPPQYKGLIDKTLAHLKRHPLFAPETLILCQHDTSELKHVRFMDIPIVQQRKYGHTTFTILKPGIGNRESGIEEGIRA